MRLDDKVKELFNISKTKAQKYIREGIVKIDDKIITKPGYILKDLKDEEKNNKEKYNIEIIEEKNKYIYVSQGALKLKKAVEEFNLQEILKDNICIDIGSSTGGFTEILLENEVKKVYSIDVGTSQLDEKLKKNNKVISIENTDFRNIQIDKENKFQNDNIDTIVGDLSFISLKKIIDKIVEIEPKNIILLIKPQFEVGEDIARKYNGVIDDKKKHIEIIEDIIYYYLDKLNNNSVNNNKNDKNNENQKYILKGFTYSEILINNLKEKKNIEYLMYIGKKNKNDEFKKIDISKIQKYIINVVQKAFDEKDYKLLKKENKNDIV
jgi:ftsJ-like methyltransferase